MATTKFLGASTVKFLGATTLKFIDPAAQTTTPQILALECYVSGSSYELIATVKNNDATTATINASVNSNMSGSFSATNIAPGASAFITIATGSTGFTGSRTAYANAQASGKTLSGTTSLTESIIVCIS
jgi:hypothetical protein